jgi:hypothetical protein
MRVAIAGGCGCCGAANLPLPDLSYRGPVRRPVGVGFSILPIALARVDWRRDRRRLAAGVKRSGHRPVPAPCLRPEASACFPPASERVLLGSAARRCRRSVAGPLLPFYGAHGGVVWPKSAFLLRLPCDGARASLCQPLSSGPLTRGPAQRRAPPTGVHPCCTALVPARRDWDPAYPLRSRPTDWPAAPMPDPKSQAPRRSPLRLRDASCVRSSVAILDWPRWNGFILYASAQARLTETAKCALCSRHTGIFPAAALHLAAVRIIAGNPCPCKR